MVGCNFQNVAIKTNTGLNGTDFTIFFLNLQNMKRWGIFSCTGKKQQHKKNGNICFHRDGFSFKRKLTQQRRKAAKKSLLLRASAITVIL
jgi:hypothetical protein